MAGPCAKVVFRLHATLQPCRSQEKLAAHAVLSYMAWVYPSADCDAVIETGHRPPAWMQPTVDDNDLLDCSPLSNRKWRQPTVDDDAPVAQKKKRLETSTRPSSSSRSTGWVQPAVDDTEERALAVQGSRFAGSGCSWATPSVSDDGCSSAVAQNPKTTDLSLQLLSHAKSSSKGVVKLNKYQQNGLSDQRVIQLFRDGVCDCNLVCGQAFPPSEIIGAWARRAPTKMITKLLAFLFQFLGIIWFSRA